MNSFVLRHSSFLLIDRHEAVRVNLPMQLRRLSIALAVLIMCAGFLPGQTQSGSETGIEGVITISPIQAGPVRADAPSSGPLANTAFVVESHQGEVTSVTTCAGGRVRNALLPGTFKAAGEGRTRNIGRYGAF